METLWSTALWTQLGAAMNMLENAVVACPDSLWNQPLWRDPSAEFWYVSYHTLFWLDLYLSGVPEEEFAPPAPFTLTELAAGVLPERPYTKEELRAYLTYIRQKGHAMLAALTDEQARRPVAYPWSEGQPMSFLELQMYNMRHVQEHAAQLCLVLGQHGIPDADLDWVPRANGAPNSL